MKKIEKVLKDKKEELLDKANTVGVGIGYIVKNGKKTGEVGLVAMVEKKLPESELEPQDIHPKIVNGVRIDVQEVGKIKALYCCMNPLKSILKRRRSKSRTDKIRPICPGISVGNKMITAGTLGILVKYKKDFSGSKKIKDYKNDIICDDIKRHDKVMILSNAHVLCDNCFKDFSEQRSLDIHQPGPYDKTPSSNTYIGKLHRYIKLEENYPAFGDRALAILDDSIPYSSEIFGYWVRVNGFSKPELGKKITKIGRTTGITSGKIIMVNASVKVDYGGVVVLHKEVFVSNAKSAGGDSGSVSVYDDNTSPGILFAGSPSTSVYTDIRHCENIWGIEPIGGEAKKEYFFRIILERVDEDYYKVNVNVYDTSEKPIKDAEVSLDGLKCKTDSDGYCRFKVKEGEYELKVTKEGYKEYRELVKIG